jgi:sulfur-carrier protein
MPLTLEPLQRVTKQSEERPVATVTLRYFAWVREKIGRNEESVTLPTDVATIADLIAWLQTLGPEYQAAFANPSVIRAAIDQTHVQASTAIGNAREIAFFPPVTGG